MATDLEEEQIMTALKDGVALNICKECDHYRYNLGGEDECLRSLTLKRNLVTGKKQWIGAVRSCDNERKDNADNFLGHCGKEGAKFVPATRFRFIRNRLK